MLKLKVLTPIIVLAALLASAGASQASQSRMIADTATSEALGDQGITPDIVAPARLVLSPAGKAVAIFPTVRKRGVPMLRGGLSVRRGSTSVVMSSLRLRGSYLIGRLGGKDRRVLHLRGLGRSGNSYTFDAAALTGDAARILRQRFTTNVFRKGLRIFLSGRIR